MLPSARPREALQRPREEERGGAYRGGRPPIACYYYYYYYYITVKVRESGNGSIRQSPRAERVGLLLTVQENVGLGRNLKTLNSFCYMTSNFNSSLVHKCLDYMSHSRRTIYTEM